MPRKKLSKKKKEVVDPSLEAMSKVLTYRNQHLPWVDRVLNLDGLDIPMGDGYATHQLSYSTFDDGSAMVFPTIVKNNNQLTQLSPEDAFNNAMSNNSGMFIPNEKLADYYSRNGLIKHGDGGRIDNNPKKNNGYSWSNGSYPVNVPKQNPTDYSTTQTVRNSTPYNQEDAVNMMAVDLYDKNKKITDYTPEQQSILRSAGYYPLSATQQLLSMALPSKGLQQIPGSSLVGGMQDAVQVPLTLMSTPYEGMRDIRGVDKQIPNQDNFIEQILYDPSTYIGAGLLTKVGRNAIRKTVNNTHYINPFAKGKKLNPFDNNSFLRQVDEETYKEGLESGLIRGKQNISREPLSLQKSFKDDAYYNKGKLYYGRKPERYPYVYEVNLPEENFIPKVNGRTRKYTTENTNVRVSKEPFSINDPNVNVYQKHWLQGYKMIDKYNQGGLVKKLNKYPEGGPISYKDVLFRQAYKESSFNPDVISGKRTSPAGAIGMTQIMPDTLTYYNNKNNTKLKATDLHNPATAVQVQKWLMDDLYNSSFINKPNQTEQVRLAKTLMAYNWGRGNASNYLNSQKEKGVDIYKSLKWMDGLPTETKDYINKILLQKDSEWESEVQKVKKSTDYYKKYYSSMEQGGPFKEDKITYEQGYPAFAPGLDILEPFQVPQKQNLSYQDRSPGDTWEDFAGLKDWTKDENFSNAGSSKTNGFDPLKANKAFDYSVFGLSLLGQMYGNTKQKNAIRQQSLMNRPSNTYYTKDQRHGIEWAENGGEVMDQVLTQEEIDHYRSMGYDVEVGDEVLD